MSKACDALQRGTRYWEALSLKEEIKEGNLVGLQTSFERMGLLTDKETTLDVIAEPYLNHSDIQMPFKTKWRTKTKEMVDVWSLLHYCVYYKQIKVVRWFDSTLLRPLPDEALETKSYLFENNLLHIAVERGDVGMAQFLMQRKPELLVGANRWKCSPLHYVSSCAMADALLKRPLSASLHAAICDLHLVYSACVRGYYDVAVRFIEAGLPATRGPPPHPAHAVKSQLIEETFAQCEALVEARQLLDGTLALRLLTTCSLMTSELALAWESLNRAGRWIDRKGVLQGPAIRDSLQGPDAPHHFHVHLLFFVAGKLVGNVVAGLRTPGGAQWNHRWGRPAFRVSAAQCDAFRESVKCKWRHQFSGHGGIDRWPWDLLRVVRLLDDMVQVVQSVRCVSPCHGTWD